MLIPSALPEFDEIGRCTEATKRAYTDGVLVIIDDMAVCLAPDDPQSARGKALSVFALMVGTLQLCRASPTDNSPTRSSSSASRTPPRY